ncbi:4Fe-4S binding protein [Solidesulfovibrio sp. C21]|uniref:4Fe-4S binding protein n=1 Tax=Solidesulfovibrio sp. C21 TaxID=3398613 RepID=UPI0039FCE048
MTLTELLAEAATGIKSLLVGLRITGKALAKPNITVLYPMGEVTNLDTYRGHVELVGKDDDPGTPRCVACGACVRACPSNCLSVACPVGDAGPKGREAEEMVGELIPRIERMAPAPQKGCKFPGVFTYDYSLCSLCGQCVRTCPVASLRFSRHAYFIGTRREDFRLDLLTRLRRQSLETSPEPAAVKESA